MLGFIKKDFLLIKANFKSMLMIFIIYFMLSFQGRFDIAFVVPLIGLMLFISTFSYDDFNNWNSYAVTVPNGRKNAVRAKYIASIIFMIVLGIVSFMISVAINYMKTNSLNLDEIIASLMGTTLSNAIVISLLYPIMFKFGSTSGRIILFVVIFTITGIGAFFMKFVDITFVLNMIDRLDNYVVIIALIIDIILLGISYLISNKIYQNKEF